jgi:nucleoside-diphosphate-sugar epimerase
MKIAATGAAGFVGTNLINDLVDQGPQRPSAVLG